MLLINKFCRYFYNSSVVSSILLFIFSGICKANENISYKKVHTSDNQLIHIIEFNPNNFKVISSHASELGKSKTQVSEFADHFKALIAINGGFFRTSVNKRYAAPAGILKNKHKWHGIAFKPRAAIGWSENSKDSAKIDILSTKTTFKVGSKTYRVNNFNPLTRYRDNAIFSFGNNKIFSQIGDCNVLSKNGKVYSVNSDTKIISKNDYVFGINSRTCQLKSNIINLPASTKVTVYPRYLKYNFNKWNNFDYIVGGAPLLVFNGTKNRNYYAEVNNKDFIESYHARTAIGIMPNKNWVIFVIEENPLLNIKGMSIPHLINFIYDYGCKYAINLDGGGSTSLYVADRLETTSGLNTIDFNLSQIRPVSDAVLVLPN